MAEGEVVEEIMVKVLEVLLVPGCSQGTTRREMSNLLLLLLFLCLDGVCIHNYRHSYPAGTADNLGLDGWFPKHCNARGIGVLGLELGFPYPNAYNNWHIN